MKIGIKNLGLAQRILLLSGALCITIRSRQDKPKDMETCVGWLEGHGYLVHDREVAVSIDTFEHIIGPQMYAAFLKQYRTEGQRGGRTLWVLLLDVETHQVAYQSIRYSPDDLPEYPSTHPSLY